MNKPRYNWKGVIIMDEKYKKYIDIDWTKKEKPTFPIEKEQIAENGIGIGKARPFSIDDIDDNISREETKKMCADFIFGVEQYMKSYNNGVKDGIGLVLHRLWNVLIKDGEQFVAGEIHKIAEDFGIEL
jgi:hypothetical protein